MPNVAIVGTEGSGKTVFITTLAKRFSADNPLGAFMNPQGRKTIQYVEQVWHTLVNAEWPPSTSPGELFDLRWTIHWQDGLVGDIRLVDCAGQDLRLLFADEQASSESIPDHLKQLAEYCKSADVMLLMVNLKDFIGENNDERRTANEWAIKYALDLWSQKGASARIAVVFTQVDQYQDVIDRYGGWKAVIKAHLPYVYGAHFRTGEIVAMAVASVSDTQVVADGDFPRRVPARDFQSTGLNEMVKWIGKQLRSVTEEANQRQIAEQQRASLQAQNAEQARRRELDRKNKEKMLSSAKWIAGFVLCFVLIVKGCSWLSSESPTTRPPVQPLQPVAPIPVIASKDAKLLGTGSFESYGIQCWGRVVNNGAAGAVTIRVQFDQPGQQSHSLYQTVQLAPGGYYDFNFSDTTDFYQANGALSYSVFVSEEGTH